MNTIKYLRQGILPAALMLFGAAFTACSDDIEAGQKVDEGAFESVNRVDGMLLDVNTNKSQSVVEMRADKHQTDLYFSLTQKPGKGVDVKIGIDEAYLAAYNAEHETNFKLFPAAQVAIERDGALLLAPDETRSASVGITLSNGVGLQAGETYAVPLVASSTTNGITLSAAASHAIYLVKVMRNANGEGESNCDKGPDAVKTVLYFEVNDTNPLNALEFVLKDSGKLFFDEIILFSSNIRYDAEKGRVYFFNNPNVQFLLDNNEQFLQPLRKRGMKVIISVLGDHDEAGVAQLSTLGARQFAKELAAYCEAYNLDGVGFDDEYSEDPDLSNPLFAPWSKEAAARLLYETKKVMPDKTVMVYYLNAIQSNIPAVDGSQPSQFVDYTVADYGGVAAPMRGMTLKNCSGMSIELNKGGGNSSESFARQQKEAGYGYYMFFALGHTNSLVSDFASYKRQVARCQSVAKGLYNQELLMPEYYYKKDDATRYKLP